MESVKLLKGYSIVVADRGFVYVGEAKWDGEWCVVRGARNIRIWGTTRGLGELALGGPTENTKLDNVGTVRIPARAVVSLIDTEAAKWNSK